MHLIDYVDNANQWAHYEFLEVFRDFAVANGWTVLRYDDVSANRELILKGDGYTGTEEIFIGMRAYQSADSNYYNLCAGAFTGYVPGNSFDNQPGAMLSGIPAHNQRIDFWLTTTPGRIAGALKVGTPVYESFYLGKMLPYARPSQYPYPLVCAGMLNGAAATRFSDTAHSMPYKGNRANLKLRTNSGIIQPNAHPWSNTFISGHLRDTGGNYPLLPVELYDANGVYGALEGVYYISGFDMVTESTLTLDGVDYVVIEDVYRTGFADYYALRMDN
jgi:hypothetical protein